MVVIVERGELGWWSVVLQYCLRILDFSGRRRRFVDVPNVARTADTLGSIFELHSFYSISD